VHCCNALHSQLNSLALMQLVQILMGSQVQQKVLLVAAVL
jgi:hypothetical protein